jgi:hypothetical protein
VNLKKAGLEPKRRYTVKRGLEGTPGTMQGRDLEALDVTVPGHGVEWIRVGFKR